MSGRFYARVAKGKQMQVGAVFRRCALQVNPHHYAKTFRGQESNGDTRSYAEAIIRRAAELDVSVLAVTDHNDVSGIPVFREAAAGHGITVFPGFELSSQEGVHVLCIYPPNVRRDKLNLFLGNFGISEPGPSTELSSQSFVDILAKVREQGGIAVAAHVTNKKGLFKNLQGQARIKAWKSNDLLAIQIPGPVDELSQDVRMIVRNKNQDYKRTRAASDDLAVAVINARDVTKPLDFDNPATTCWIKMSEVSVEGLRQAFLDPGSRIRLNPEELDSEVTTQSELVSIAWEGGFLDGTSVQLNPNLNVLVGGRGAGKSTFIESLRYVLKLNPIGDEAKTSHMGIVRQVLRSGTKISLHVRSHRPSMREYRIERTVPNPPVVRDYNGEVLHLLPKDILPRVEVYGQREISELTRRSDRLTRLLDRFATPDPSLARRRGAIRQVLETTRRSILDANHELEQIESQLATLPSLEETLDRFREAGLEKRLNERSLLVREERVFQLISDQLRPMRECLDALRLELPVERGFLSPKSLQDLPGREILAKADCILARLSTEVENIADRFDRALKTTDKEIEQIRTIWSARKQQIERSYERILRELGSSAVDGAEFIRVQKQIESLRPLRKRQALLEQKIVEYKRQRRQAIAEWEDLKGEEFRLLARAAKEVTKKLRGRVTVEVTAMGNLRPLLDFLRNEIGGRLKESLDILAAEKELSISQFVDYCRDGSNALTNAYSIPPAQAKRLASVTEDTLMRVEELELPSTTEIKLNTASSDSVPVWQTLENLSTGQKSTAVLLLLLLDSDGPLIVDQPEDDLDNRFVTEGIIPRMREEKRRRQFIFSTHNANIPVLGDAEIIIGLTPAGDADQGQTRIAPEHVGSIDKRSVRELVESLLEGGKDAFETRRLKYGF